MVFTTTVIGICFCLPLGITEEAFQSWMNYFSSINLDLWLILLVSALLAYFESTLFTVNPKGYFRI